MVRYVWTPTGMHALSAEATHPGPLFWSLEELHPELDGCVERTRAAERARIRRELLEAIAENKERIEGGVCGQPGQCNLPEHILTVVPVGDLLAALDRIVPEGKE